jgi:hypothetical protein
MATIVPSFMQPLAALTTLPNTMNYGRPGILDIVSGGTRPSTFQTPELTEDERGRATRYGVMSGLMAGSRSGIVGGILGAMLGGKQGREAMIYDKYLDKRMSDPSYGSDRYDRLMAQRYGGESYIRPPTDRAPQRPISHTRVVPGPNGTFLEERGFVGEGGFEGTGVPYPPSAMSRTGTSRGDLSDERTSSQIQAAREWARNFRRTNPKEWNNVWTRQSNRLTQVEQERLRLLNKRDPNETQEEYNAWNQWMAESGRPAEGMATGQVEPESGRWDWAHNAAGFVRGKASGILDAASGIGIGGVDPGAEGASALERRLIEQGILTP